MLIYDKLNCTAELYEIPQGHIVVEMNAELNGAYVCSECIATEL